MSLPYSVSYPGGGYVVEDANLPFGTPPSFGYYTIPGETFLYGMGTCPPPPEPPPVDCEKECGCTPSPWIRPRSRRLVNMNEHPVIITSASGKKTLGSPKEVILLEEDDTPPSVPERVYPLPEDSE